MTKRTGRKLVQQPERRPKAMSRSGTGDSGRGTDWFQEALTPNHLKPVQEYIDIDLGDPVELDPVEEAEDKKVQTPAIHMTLRERFIKETEV